MPSLRALFRKFDRDDSGNISKSELRSALEEMGVRASRTELDEIMDGLDRDANGLISYREFVAGARSARNAPSSRISSAIARKLRNIVADSPYSKRCA